MRKDKDIILKLRSQGKSYKEIQNSTGISKGTLSGWLSRHRWSQETAIRLNKKHSLHNTVRIIYLNKIRGQKLARLYEQGDIEAKEEFARLKYHPLFITGLALYWGEGDRVSKYGVLLSNTDPAMIKLFRNFLIQVCHVKKDRLFAGVFLYPDLDGETCRKYWSKEAGLSGVKFHKDVELIG